jgi:anti-anti-sigma regulatory factor
MRITIQEKRDAIEMTLEGNVAEGFVAQLGRTWLDTAQRQGKKMLRITIHEDDKEIGMTLEGRIAGPWVEELNQAWLETASRLGGKKLSLDLRNVTYSDAGGTQVLRDIYARTNAELVAGTLWAEYLAEEIKNSEPENDEEPDHGYDA